MDIITMNSFYMCISNYRYSSREEDFLLIFNTFSLSDNIGHSQGLNLCPRGHEYLNLCRRLHDHYNLPYNQYTLPSYELMFANFRYK